ncbi:MAG: ATP-binding protein [Oscillospiraceae bacterium]|nr:ATP-binding protein [Oscillospiraceae bacterium]
MVKITLIQENEKAIIRISDDGNGINEQDLPNIFDRFFKGKSGNFGLGLAIAKSAVEFMKGNIIAYNQDGAVFEIRLNTKKDGNFNEAQKHGTNDKQIS